MFKNYILLAETLKSQVERLQNILFDLNIEIKWVQSSALVTTALKNQGQPSLIIVGAELIDIDGLSLIKNLRKQKSLDKTSIFYWSKKDRPSFFIRSQCKKLDVSAILSHTSKAKTIRETVELALASSRRHQSENFPKPDFSRLLRPHKSANQDKGVAREKKISALKLNRKLPLKEAFRCFLKEGASIYGANAASVIWAVADGKYQIETMHADGQVIKSATVERLSWPGLPLSMSGQYEPPLVIGDTQQTNLFSKDDVIPDFARAYLGGRLIGPGGVTQGAIALHYATTHCFSEDETTLWRALSLRLSGELLLNSENQPLSFSAANISTPRDRNVSFKEIANVTEAIGQGLLIYDNQRKIIFANRVVSYLFDIPISDLLNMKEEEFTLGCVSRFEDPTLFLEKTKTPLSGQYAATDIFEMQHPQRRVIRWTARPLEINGEDLQLCRYEDITHITDAQNKLEQLVSYDMLTNTLNRRAFETVVEAEISRSLRYKFPFCISIFQLRDLATVNENYGHGMGDRLLKEVALHLQKNIRKEDTISRWSGSSLAVLMPQSEEDGLTRRVNNICTQLNTVQIEGFGKLQVATVALVWEKGMVWQEALTQARMAALEILELSAK